MTRDDIIRMAREAREQVAKELPPGTFDIDLFHERFAALVEAPLENRIQDLYRQIETLEKQLDDQYKLGMEAEREACAKLCDEYASSGSDHEAGAALNIQDAIRARGN